jgi:hypothetical protein
MNKTLRLPDCDQQGLSDQVQLRLVELTELERFKELLDEHHYLGSFKAVGERLHYVAPMPKVNGSPCWSSVPQPSTSNIATNGSDGALHSATGA